MNDIRWCICGQRATELHHIVFRSQCKPLDYKIDVKENGEWRYLRESDFS